MTTRLDTSDEARRDPLREPHLDLAFEIRVDVAEDLHIGRGANERLAFTPIIGGTVDGPLLHGEVLAGGGDWSVQRDDTFQLEARYLIRTEDGATIDILNRGYYRETANPESPYFRTAPVFQTDSAAHRWLTEHQFLGLARDEDQQIRIRVFVVR
ncbi:DUF3237 domain-containing protein [Microbacterium sp. MMO-10]|uniref:DUF3237 domain-containing protein n=1 Tax=Microbacterium sp. MMO-10 TaxID=3081272 RepID=UPI0030161FD5